MDTRTTMTDADLSASNDIVKEAEDDAEVNDGLPLVLVTVGNGVGEFEALYNHLEDVGHKSDPGYQSLIVARHDVPDVLYSVLRSRVRNMPNVYLRRLGSSSEDCAELKHSSGTFLALRKQPKKTGV